MPYPDLPKNRIIVNGVDICERFKIALLDGYTLSPPKPKTYTVDIPGGDGIVDLTEALTGNVVYENRSMEFTFACIFPDDWERTKTELSNFLHGRAYDYTLTFDPGYTYHGRFKVESYAHQGMPGGKLGSIKMIIDANPYKRKNQQLYKLNAVGGKLFRLESGRRPVHPIVECNEPFRITYNGKTTWYGAGKAYKLLDVTFVDGWNEIYINSQEFWDTYWYQLAEGEPSAKTWDQAKTYTWDSIQLLNNPSESIPKDWENLASTRWNEVEAVQWNAYRPAIGNGKDIIVYLQYDWEDL